MSVISYCEQMAAILSPLYDITLAVTSNVYQFGCNTVDRVNEYWQQRQARLQQLEMSNVTGGDREYHDDEDDDDGNSDDDNGVQHIRYDTLEKSNMLYCAYRLAKEAIISFATGDTSLNLLQ